MIDHHGESRRIVHWICLIGLVTGTLLMASPAFGSINYILASLVVDDSFYYLLPAFNVTHGLGITFDGVNATNGFQPLWMLTLLPVALFTNDRELLLRMTVVYQAVLYALAVWLIARVALRAGKALRALLTVVIWMAFGLRHDLAISVTTNGLESALFFLMLALGFVVTLRASQRCLAKVCTLHSTIMALIILARLDSILIAGPLLGLVAWCKVRQDGLRKARRELLPGWGIGVAFILIYVGWNIYTVGIPLPVSGMIKAWHAHTLASQQFGGMTTPSFANQTVQVFFRSLVLITSQIAVIILPPDVNRMLRMRLVSSTIHPGRAVLFTSLFVIGMAALAIATRKSWLKRLSPWHTTTAIVALGAFTHLAVHSVLMWPYALYNVWHYTGQLFVALVVVTGVNSGGIRIIRQHSRAAAGTALGLLVFSVVFAQTKVICQNLGSLFRPFPLPSNERAGLFRASLWTGRLPAAARLGAFNAGIAGYFSPHSVTNLDGLINSPTVYRQLKEGLPLNHYIVGEGIDYIIDYAPEGRWPMPESGGVHYLDLYAKQSAAFVIDTQAWEPSSTDIQKEPCAAWLVSVRNRAGELEWWVGTAWDAVQAESARWQITLDTEQVIAGPFDVEGAWLPEVPSPPRANELIYDYRQLPPDGYGHSITLQTTTSSDNWASGCVIHVPSQPDAGAQRHEGWAKDHGCPISLSLFAGRSDQFMTS